MKMDEGVNNSKFKIQNKNKTKTLVETAIYRVSKIHNFVQLALNPSVLTYSASELSAIQT
jgi:hypothetical protein